MKHGVKDIQKHRFFKDLDWDEVQSRQIDSVPYIPKISDQADTKNYARYSEDDSNCTQDKCPLVDPAIDPFLGW